MSIGTSAFRRNVDVRCAWSVVLQRHCQSEELEHAIAAVLLLATPQGRLLLAIALCTDGAGAKAEAQRASSGHAPLRSGLSMRQPALDSSVVNAGPPALAVSRHHGVASMAMGPPTRVPVLKKPKCGPVANARRV